MRQVCSSLGFFGMVAQRPQVGDATRYLAKRDPAASRKLFFSAYVQTNQAMLPIWAGGRLLKELVMIDSFLEDRERVASELQNIARFRNWNPNPKLISAIIDWHS